ncbi:unnamed protein product [Ranitomeya imitator]|uniref:DH domain-containing protein n=1 Tax=Ranitomeya imitator TaxID=111125 RepID=A0ABN9M819_9NEOB|nr:unnamed protein product [Ranitomeya imitator]
MFTLVTGIVGRWRAVCVTALQRPNSDAAAIRIVVGIAAASLSVTTTYQPEKLGQDTVEADRLFFEDLEKRHKDNPFIHDISDIVENHASNHFQPYVIYCSNEMYQQRTLQRLITSNVTFKETLKQIEMKPECGGLPMFSFLILPMQRVTRLPLLMDTICQKTDSETPEYEACTRALKAISKGKHRVTKRRAALSNPMFTLVTSVKKQTVHTYIQLSVPCRLVPAMTAGRKVKAEHSHSGESPLCDSPLCCAFTFTLRPAVSAGTRRQGTDS